jgi:MerR family transcriptional regulator, heat shock protein HspR
MTQVPARGEGHLGWEARLDDPAAPLYTIAVVAELLGVDQQVLRRLDVEGIVQSARPSGNQRRYSRDDIAVMAYVLTLREQGIPRAAVVRILTLERDVARLAAEAGHTVTVRDGDVDANFAAAARERAAS